MGHHSERRWEPEDICLSSHYPALQFWQKWPRNNGAKENSAEKWDLHGGKGDILFLKSASLDSFKGQVLGGLKKI